MLKETKFVLAGDHPKTAEAIARKINLILGDTRESLAAKTGRSPEEVYDDEFSAVVIHGDDIDGLQGWQWDQSAFHPIRVLRALTCISFCQGRNCVCSNFPQA